MMNTMKKLTKIKLVNWHYFSNETISVNGSFLISGENASGKSTILDAIQLVLTTNTRRFNPAANEKSKRDLKGYVRCKTGEEGNTYHRTGSVISYVALEFYEESKDKYFVIGVKLDSHDPESDIKKKWFCEEGTIEGISFIVDNKPAFDDKFQNNGKKISLIYSQNDAKNRFKRRMGNLDESFFEMIPKSLAFKPMDDIKSFINKFILSKKQVDVGVLRENIRSLKEMQGLLDQVKSHISRLEEILAKYRQVQKTDNDILVIDILLKIAELENKKSELDKISLNISEAEQNLGVKRERLNTENETHERENNILKELEFAILSNENTRLIEKLNAQLQSLEKDKKQIEERLFVLKEQTQRCAAAVDVLNNCGLSGADILAFETAEIPVESKNRTVTLLEKMVETETQAAYAEKAENNFRTGQNKEKLLQLKNDIDKLKNNRIIYPENTERLRQAIEKEFSGRSIDSEVRIFADLLEITDSRWQNAVEGYLNTQRFNIIVEPRYYDIAAEVYDRLKKEIHSVALVNTGALKPDEDVKENSLATVVVSDNRYAKAYADYLMGRVVMCDSVSELKAFPVSITSDCMLYKGNALRKLAPSVYKTPYIGKYALRRQLEIKQEEYGKLQSEQALLTEQLKKLDSKLSVLGRCNFEKLKDVISAPYDYENIKMSIDEKNKELNEAEKDPTIIELHGKYDEQKEKVNTLKKICEGLLIECTTLENNMVNLHQQEKQLQQEIATTEDDIRNISKDNETALNSAKQKFAEHSRQKNAGTIYSKNQRNRDMLVKQRQDQHDELTDLQGKYKGGELGRGEEVISAYYEEHGNLSRHDMIRYEEKLAVAKENCEIEFKESFLAKMRENIEQAKSVFSNLNKALNSIYYGNDSYKFRISHNKNKEGLYKMITSDFNIGGETLFIRVFEEQYQNEMDELFSKLTESDESGESVLSEYIDYRSYLDYDIEIVSKDGKKQWFSEIYGEKSGGETQTPYYVAIAASFSQIYSYGESIRIIMLDEAFDKMDDDRIESMMSFFRNQNFQIILATPPAKMEVVGEYVDTILVAYREGYSSTVEEYTYEEI